ncbi:hypothetical protein QMZ92_34335 [Streptomyces sp. HNM0645]|uniref:hypothetical protein n=1 Tax=Streptomyces sp. HNM0645 TaxID=2782343 RepID=UPI0024B74514|nr:hypothetical protein [Streptomyces sp. HNM0645]MDI9889267.1 hypothetical protein [Streptomyces sp. HNM0645]
MQEPMVLAAAVGVAAAMPRILLFWLMSRERRRIIGVLTEAGDTALVLDHHGPGRARVMLLPGRWDARGSR